MHFDPLVASTFIGHTCEDGLMLRKSLLHESVCRRLILGAITAVPTNLIPCKGLQNYNGVTALHSLVRLDVPRAAWAASPNHVRKVLTNM